MSGVGQKRAPASAKARAMAPPMPRVGRYRVEARLSNDSAKLKSVTVIADTGTVPSLLATPI